MGKVIFLTEAGKKTGFGHLTRCLALSQAIMEAGDFASVEIIIDGDNLAREFLRKENQNVYFFKWFKEQGKALKKIKTADKIVLDSYVADKAFYDMVSELTGGNVIMIDDYRRMEYPQGTVVNPSICGDRLDYTQNDGTVYLLGKNYIILRKKFWNIPEKKINKEVKNILVTFGGVNHPDLIYKIINHLKSKFKFNFYAVEPEKNRYDSGGMLDLMMESDVCISGGGQTTYELARVGVPTIGICFAENQRLILEEWCNEGFIEYIGWHNDENLLDKIKNAINNLASHEERVKRKQIGRNLVDGRGAKNIIANCLNIYKKNE